MKIVWTVCYLHQRSCWCTCRQIHQRRHWAGTWGLDPDKTAQSPSLSAPHAWTCASAEGSWGRKKKENSTFRSLKSVMFHARVKTLQLGNPERLSFHLTVPSASTTQTRRVTRHFMIAPAYTASGWIHLSLDLNRIYIFVWSHISQSVVSISVISAQAGWPSEIFVLWRLLLIYTSNIQSSTNTANKLS